MFWFTLGSIEIGDNEMIGMPKDIALLAYAKHPGIETWNPRTWEHASNEVFMADLPILECSDFTGYANLAGFRIRMNNSSALSLFKSDFGGIDVFGYLPQIKPAAGYNKPGPAGRLNQNISNLELWNNEIGVRTRYSTKTRLDKVVVDNGLRYGNTIDVAPGIESQQAINDHEYLNTSISNYGVGLFIYKKNTDINNPGTSFEIESGNLKNTGNDLYNMDDSICADASSVKATDIISTSATINIAAHSELKRMVVRYKSEKDHYWNYTSIENSNSIELQDLYIDNEYAYQVLVGCEFSPSKWSEDKFFTTKCTDKTGGYKIGAEWTYGTFTAPACTGDKLRIRLRTGNGVGSSTYTKPNGDVVKGNSHNTLLINSVALDDFGTYTAEYIDQTGCISNYNFNVIPKNQPDDEPCDDNTPKISDISPIEFGLYPNPVLDNDVVSLSGEGIEYVEVFDMMGKWLNKQNFNAPESLVTINCSGFKSGIYFAKINGKEVLKFIYQR